MLEEKINRNKMESWMIIAIVIIVLLLLTAIGIIVYYYAVEKKDEVEKCESNEDCLLGMVCNVDGQCVPDDKPCDGDDDCPAGQHCSNGICKPDGKYCTNSSACDMGERCLVGIKNCGPIFINGEEIVFRSLDASYFRTCNNGIIAAGGFSRSTATRFTVEYVDETSDGYLYRFRAANGLYLVSNIDYVRLGEQENSTIYEVMYDDTEDTISMSQYGSPDRVYQAGSTIVGECGKPLLVWNESEPPSNAEAIFYQNYNYNADKNADIWRVPYSTQGTSITESPTGISSVQLVGINVRIFDQVGGGGRAGFLQTDVPDLRYVPRGDGNWNDRIRSVQLVPIGINNRPNPYSFQLRYESV